MGKHELDPSQAHAPAAPLRRKPAVEALFIFLLAHVATLFVTGAASSVLDWHAGLVPAVIVQGMIAAILTHVRRQAPWWVAMQAVFPAALLGLSWLQLPSWLFLATFVFLLALYWSTFRTQVPYFPSTRTCWDAVHAQLPPGRPLSVIDIGSGMGGLVLDGAKRRPESRFAGIEIAPLPYSISWLRNALAGRPGSFLRGDYRQLDFSGFDAVFAYLSPAAMPDLWHKAKNEMRKGSVLMSYEFIVPEATPDRVLQPKSGGPFLYVWKF